MTETHSHFIGEETEAEWQSAKEQSWHSHVGLGSPVLSTLLILWFVCIASSTDFLGRTWNFSPSVPAPPPTSYIGWMYLAGWVYEWRDAEGLAKCSENPRKELFNGHDGRVHGGGDRRAMPYGNRLVLTDDTVAKHIFSTATAVMTQDVSAITYLGGFGWGLAYFWYLLIWLC